MDERCDVCQAVGTAAPLVEVGLVGVGPVWIHRCRACGFRQVRPRLTAADLAALYGAEYFDTSAARGFRGYARQRQRYERDAFFLAKELQTLRPFGRLLEVGSALGFLLGPLARMTAWQVEGVEVSAFGAWYARDRFGVTVHQATLEEARLPSDAFDYVIQKDLLEHVLDPRRHLAETGRIMRVGARLRLITPNGEADVRPLCRAAASSTGLPRLGQGHLSFFSRPLLCRLLAETGFRVVRFRNIGLRRGVRALGFARAAVVPRDRLTVRSGSGPEAAAPADHAALAARLDADIASSHRPVRQWRPYYYYRRALKRLDTLPSVMTVGQDFDVLAEKR